MTLNEIPWIKAKEKWVFGKVLDIPEGSFAILVQDKQASFAKYHYPTYEEPFISFSHPQNEEALSKEITDIILKEKPSIRNSEDAKIYFCPQEWHEKAIW